MQSANCALARRLKMCRWIVLLSLWKNTGMERLQKMEHRNEIYSDIIKLKHV